MCNRKEASLVKMWGDPIYWGNRMRLREGKVIQYARKTVFCNNKTKPHKHPPQFFKGKLIPPATGEQDGAQGGM